MATGRQVDIRKLTDQTGGTPSVTDTVMESPPPIERPLSLISSPPSLATSTT